MESTKGRVNFYNLKMTKTESLWEVYSEVEEATSGSVSNNYGVLPNDQLDLLLTTHDLTEFQKDAVGCLYSILSTVNLVDPEKLVYNVFVNSEQDLILSRKTNKGLHSLIIHDDELVVYSFISLSNKQLDKFEPYENLPEIDFEKLVYQFLM